MRTHVVLPDELIKGVDKFVGKRNRSRFIAESVEKALKRERLLMVLREGAGVLDASTHPEWETPEKVAEWVRALRETPSIREQGDYALSARLNRGDRLAARKTPRAKPSR